nr:hypothetical protein [Tanacetum cinerariifolium]
GGVVVDGSGEGAAVVMETAAMVLVGCGVRRQWWCFGGEVAGQQLVMPMMVAAATATVKTVASESNQKPRNITRKLYERVSKTYSWWYPKFTPSGYRWKPKSGKENVNPNVSMPLGNASRTANVMDPMTSRRSTVSNTPMSSNSFVARRDCPIHRRLWVLKAHDEKSQASN